MPTFRHGKSAFVSVASGGSTTKLSTGMGSDAELQRMVDSAEVTVFGNSDKVYLSGLRGAQFSIKGHFDKTIAGTLAGLLGAATHPTWVYGPESTAASRRKYTFSGMVTSLNAASPVGDKVSMEMGVLVSGAVTSTTF